MLETNGRLVVTRYTAFSQIASVCLCGVATPLAIQIITFLTSAFRFSRWLQKLLNRSAHYSLSRYQHTPASANLQLNPCCASPELRGWSPSPLRTPSAGGIVDWSPKEPARFALERVGRVLRPVFVVACVLDQNLLRHKTYWICHLHLLRRCEWVSVGLAQTYAPRCEQ